MDWNLIGQSNGAAAATDSGFGDFLIGTGKNIISRVVDQEFPGAQTFNDPVALGKAESSGNVFQAGQPAGIQVAGVSLSPMVLWVAGLLGLSLLLVVALRK